MATFTADAVIEPLRFTVDAFVFGKGYKHHRVNDHYGPESDLHVTLTSDIGKYPSGTPIHYVLDDLASRIIILESSDHIRASFSLDAIVDTSATFSVDASVAGTSSGSFDADAWFSRGDTFALDAWLKTAFTVDAFLT